MWDNPTETDVFVDEIKNRPDGSDEALDGVRNGSGVAS